MSAKERKIGTFEKSSNVTTQRDLLQTELKIVVKKAGLRRGKSSTGM